MLGLPADELNATIKRWKELRALGTKGGPRTTVDCEVLDVDDAVIPGLWAVGNAMAAPTGMVYGGAGGTLGPAIVFGYRCGLSAAGAPLGSAV
ncbi:FAD-binding protein [Streptomyces carpinensis]|uniref:FAD-binding protein n=1 Tax=Streptomyces carpinensis TaxID=66369 RepID=A0ABV1VV62_9ACTN|nr:FAD-binding protein [Streptomyces carpinensis]